MRDFDDDAWDHDNPCSNLIDGPISLRAQRAMVAAQMDAIVALVPHLSTEGLQVARQRLKAPALLAVVRTGGTMAEAHAELLSRLCGLLADRLGMPIEYYIGLGDVMPDVPDYIPDFGGPDVR